MIAMRLVIVGLASMVAVGCGEKSEGPDLPSPICSESQVWSPGNQVFSEQTDAWGLGGVEGTRLLAVDFDGDGWTDLVIHRGGNDPDDFSEGGVRQSWLLRNREGNGFEDVTRSSGFRAPRANTEENIGRAGSVIAFADVDNDGDLDAYTGLASGNGSETSEIMLNNGDGTFSLGPLNSELRRASGDAPAGASFVDYNRDGNIDLWVTQNTIDGVPQQDRLYQGDGAGNFVDVTDAMGLTTEDWTTVQILNQAQGHTVAWSALACDLNNDGNPELLSASYGRAPNHLWQAKADNTYKNRSLASGYAFDHRTDWSDNESARCYCKFNRTAPECADVAEPQFIACNNSSDAFRWSHNNDRQDYRLGGNSAATLCADVNNDGAMDLFTTEIVHWDVGSSSDPTELLINSGEEDIRFDRPGNAATGLTRERDRVDWNDGDMSGAIFDFDNDGWPDVYLGSSDYPGTRGHLWRQNTKEPFVPVPTSDSFEHLRAHGSAVADFDRDGDLDIVVGHSRFRCNNECYETAQIRLFENQLNGNFIQVRLLGSGGANTSAIGARVSLTAGNLTQTQEVGGGFGHYGAQNDLVLHFGLGSECSATVRIRWPDGDLQEQEWTLNAGYRYQLQAGLKPVIVGVSNQMGE